MLILMFFLPPWKTGRGKYTESVKPENVKFSDGKILNAFFLKFRSSLSRSVCQPSFLPRSTLGTALQEIAGLLPEQRPAACPPHTPLAGWGRDLAVTQDGFHGPIC